MLFVMARVALDGASVVIDVLHDNQHEGGTRPPDGRNVEEDAQGPYHVGTLSEHAREEERGSPGEGAIRGLLSM